MSGPATGSLLGLALGDALGAPHEGGPLGGAIWWTLGRLKPDVLRYTDDTQMALVLAEHLAEYGGVEPDSLASCWAAAYDAKRGYGGGAAKLLKRIRAGERWPDLTESIFPGGSFGNGGAMRVAPIGLAFGDAEQRRSAAADQARITHAHPEGLEGAVILAEAVACAAAGMDDVALTVRTLLAVAELAIYRRKLGIVQHELERQPGPRETVTLFGHGVRAADSVVTAIYAWLRHRDQSFEALLQFVIALGGDTDTIGAMAGALWGAAHGETALPPEPLAKLEDADRLRTAGAALDRLRSAQ